MANLQDFNVNDTSFLTLARGGSGSRPGGTGIDTFTSLGTTYWICPTGVTSVTYLVVGGGGGGGSGAVSANNGGGGGGGGFLTGDVAVTPGTQYTVVVGAGGAPDNQGGYSQFSATAGFAIVALGGGYGGGQSPALPGGSGGSGGGGGPAVPRTAGSGIIGQGNNGGAGNPNSPFQGGGGGGAGAVGGSPSGNGGGGSSSTITGSSVIYAGGGGGGADSSAGDGGPGGGGYGALPFSRAPAQGTDGLGGGGGGGSSQQPAGVATFDSITGARGGHGIVILKYTLPVASPKRGQIRYNTSNNVPELYNGSAWDSLNNFYDGSTAQRAAPSAEYIKATTGTNTDGVYWINLPTVGATQVYCLMNSAANGGGWMMAMKATRGTTFNYSSAYWTAINTLNTGQTNRNDGDAKFDVFNYHNARDIMALWPDITTNGGGLGTNPYNCWSWLDNNFYQGLPTTLVNFFNSVGWYNTGNVGTANNYGGYFRGLAKSFSGWASGIFSSQNAINFYGFNFKNPQNYSLRAYVRWGFGWNENGEGNWSSPATQASGGAPGSNDVSGGIGMDSSYGNYSSGDYIGCCQDSTGINRSARVEVYVR